MKTSLTRWMAVVLLVLIGVESKAQDSESPRPPPRPSPWSVGVFVNMDSQPYKGADSDIRVFPSVAYRGEDLQWLGPYIRKRILKREAWSLAVHTAVQFPAYEEDDAPILEGMGDRSTTLLAGVDLDVPLSAGVDFRISIDGEVLGAHDGIQTSAAFTKSIGRPFLPVSGSLGAGVHFQDQNWTRNSVGVPSANAASNRPAYAPGESFHPFLAGTVMLRFHRHWSLLTLARIEFLDETWRDSPLIGDSQRLTGFVTLNYTF